MKTKCFFMDYISGSDDIDLCAQQIRGRDL
jgi:hypothetical protein